MSTSPSRRQFLGQTAATLSSAAILPGFAPVTRAGLSLPADAVQFHPEIESLVRFIEDTPRQRLMEEIGRRVQTGTSYRELLAGLFLAAIRNVQPRPHVGFKFHAVLVVHSAHLASMASPDADRWLPIFWALDEFKSSQARDVQEGDWTMSAVNEAAVPSAEQAHSRFHETMQRWDEDGVDTATAGLVRYAGATEVFEAFARYAARDYRSIGHKAIFTANAWRTLQTIGWQHAEPVFRSLAYAMVNHHGQPNPADSDLEADRPWRHNKERAAKIRNGWPQGRLDKAATQTLMTTFRNGTPTEASTAVVDVLNSGVSPQSVLDAIHTVSAEMLMQQTGIIALHAVTTSNAIRFLFDATGDDRTRLLLLLQNASFLPMFRQSMHSRGSVGSQTVDSLPAETTDADSAGIDRIFLNVGRNRTAAADGVYQYLEDGNSVGDLMNTARRLIFLKGSNSHDYKFSSALLEDYHKVSPAFRHQFLAAGSTMLRGSSLPDNGLVERIRAALS